MTLWPHIADLELTVERVGEDVLEPGPGFGGAHSSRLVRLTGAGAEGLGEDITLFMGGGALDLDLAGAWTPAGFCDHLHGTDQWPDGPPESQRFKLDAAASWTPEVIDALAGTGAVHTLDFKGQYGLEVDDVAALARVYERLIDTFPEALLEDPHDLPEIAPLVEPHAARVAYDAPIVTAADLDATPLPAAIFNIKPTRVGRLEALLDLYAECERRGARMYGGGMGELGVARGQIQLLAALFSPDGPNDIAPPGFNALEPESGLPVSPLEPRPAPTGFRRR